MLCDLGIDSSGSTSLPPDCACPSSLLLLQLRSPDKESLANATDFRTGRLGRLFESEDAALMGRPRDAGDTLPLEGMFPDEA